MHNSKNHQTVIFVHGLGDNRYSNYPLAEFFLEKWCGNIINKFKLGFTYQDADVAQAMKNTQTPVLIINSKVDTTTPYFMGKEIYDARILLRNKRGADLVCPSVYYA